MEIKDIVKPAVTIPESATFRDAVSEMIEKQTNTLLVVSGEGTLVGEIGVSDLLDAVVPSYLDGDSIAAHFATEEMFKEAVSDAELKPATEFMATDLSPLTLNDSLMTVASIAIAQRRARIPVVDEDNRPVGMVSRRGLKHILANYLNINDSV